MSFLTEFTRIPTSGARAVEPFDLDGAHLLAIPQLAYDVPGTPANMNGGDSTTDLLLLRRKGDGYEPVETVPAPGGEDAEFFRIGDRAFLATASIRTGAGPYEFETTSRVFEWRGGRFEEFQAFLGFAAKQWRHFEIDGTHFLALAQGVVVPETGNRASEIFRWDGAKFVPFQTIPAQWAYNWHHFELGGQHYLAHADNVEPSNLYRWDGTRFVLVQALAERGGRAFADFTADGERYLLVACLQTTSHVLRWDGRRFVEHQELEGLGAREFAVIEGERGIYVVRVNFVLGSREDPKPHLLSQLYRWLDGELVVVEEFETNGAVDAAVFTDDDGVLVAVANALSPEVRFATDTVVYRFTEQERK